MSVSSWLPWAAPRNQNRRAKRRNPVSRTKAAGLFLEQLESRVTPSFGLSVLALFNVANSQAGLITDATGNLYGTNGSGGATGNGTVFEIAKGSGTITTLASFNGTDGQASGGTLIVDSSGNLYGTASSGGAANDGTVFELAKGSATITTLASFDGTNGADPQDLIVDQSGNLYGTCSLGGASNLGTVFELAHGSGTITALASFNGTTGQDPQVPLVIDKSGNLYGTTYQGGAYNAPYGDGTVFEVAHGSGTITTLVSFNGTNGSGPIAGLVIDSSGNLFGTTIGGPNCADGTVFEMAHGSSTITTLALFNGTNGFYPSGLIMDSRGNLYGTTVLGGPTWNDSTGVYGYGTVFELAHGTGTITTLASFNGSDGARPEAGLIMDSSGNFYGTTSEGAYYNDGTLFEVLPHTPALSWNTPAAITYGTALSSTQLDAGAADAMTGAPVAGTFVYTPAPGTILHVGVQTLTVTFTPTDTTDYSPITTRVGLMVYPATPVLIWNTPAPIPYGTPVSGTQLDATAANPNNGSAVSGTYVYTPPAGTIFPRGSNYLYVTFTPADTTEYYTAKASVTLSVTPSYSLSTLASFGTPNGARPYAPLIMDKSGNLYGTTYAGGASNDGTVFEVAHGSGAITTLASLNGTDGLNPYGGLIMDESGNLYGTAQRGGASGLGTVFEVAAATGTITTLASFNGTNGAIPYGALIMDSSGNLYGTTFGYSFYKTSYPGTVFELAHASGTITTLATFNGTNLGGVGPEDALIMDSSGNLYGTTKGGGLYGGGTVFELVHGSRTITTLASITNGKGSGAAPCAALIMDGSGNLYGTASIGGGNYMHGTVFELVRSSHTMTTLTSFNGTDGVNPYGGLIMDSSGNLYGTTAYGGASNFGTVFELPKGSGTITTLFTFNGTNGAGPEDALLMDASGNMYGTTTYGGASNVGTVFELPAALQPSLQKSGLASRTSAGTSPVLTVAVQSAVGATDTGYLGTVKFTSTDSAASLPANDAGPDIGTDPFSGVVPQKKGKSTIADALSRSITGSLSVNDP
jgi:uncharacterized repeat protein (TIGR03803 family)